MVLMFYNKHNFMWEIKMYIKRIRREASKTGAQQKHSPSNKNMSRMPKNHVNDSDEYILLSQKYTQMYIIS
jgi:hypothetical protein